ncbi:DNA-binding response regulator [Porphyrobacter sp. HT-58-2]|uniref:response regulator n=1 Tax=Porphyrobacter sp. HT-58-2 TaxID=2023229 RepID=UPI000CDC3552|nr:response regulator [Porphyrobacter sp. HT-58-2]AUX70319.1 DNA-binding response regulator [Porphyrobacter sp. HT-58-2]
MIATDRPSSARDCILVVDDNPESLRFLVDTLEAEGMDVLIARSGEATLELLGEVLPHLILMDAVMPGLSGLETTRRIKANPASAHIPVIFMTGLTDPDHVIAALETGGVDYVRKPVVVGELLARMRVHLANARASYRSRLALGRAGRSLAAIGIAGDLLWCTPQAEGLFQRLDPDWDSNSSRVPLGLAPALAQLRGDPGHGSNVTLKLAGIEIEVALAESDRPEEALFKITEVGEASKVDVLLRNTDLTRREAEVLLWVSYGKTNRTVSEILGISPRTVNKHLEQVFRKLGVETRAAATAVAVRYLSE